MPQNIQEVDSATYKLWLEFGNYYRIFSKPALLTNIKSQPAIENSDRLGIHHFRSWFTLPKWQTKMPAMKEYYLSQDIKPKLNSDLYYYSKSFVWVQFCLAINFKKYPKMLLVWDLCRRMKMHRASMLCRIIGWQHILTWMNQKIKGTG